MIILGHELIPFDPLYKVTNIEDIKKTAPNSTVLFDFDNQKVLEYCKVHDISFALYVDSITKACISNALRAKYIVADYELSKKVQTIATEYLFDTKVLLIIEEEIQIELAAESSIDGVIFKDAIISLL
jgi:hypothetical protein